MPPVTYHFGQPSFAVYWPRLLNFGRPIPEGTRLFRIQQRMADRFQRVRRLLSSSLSDADVVNDRRRTSVLNGSASPTRTKP